MNREDHSIPGGAGRACAFQIRLDDLGGSQVIALLETHLALMRSISPPESTHALDMEQLRAPGMSVWTCWEGEALLGCGALKALGVKEGEIKSMHTAAPHRGRGVAGALLTRIIAEARSRGYSRLLLETGAEAVFAPAKAFYRAFGFAECEPFADYRHDPYSIFMRLDL